MHAPDLINQFIQTWILRWRADEPISKHLLWGAPGVYLGPLGKRNGIVREGDERGLDLVQRQRLGRMSMWTNTVANGATGSPAKKSFQTAVYDPSSNRMTIFGGVDNSNVWVLENAKGVGGASSWIELSPTDTAPLYQGKLVNEPFLRDTVNVPYYTGRALFYPSVRLRMDFRDPNTVGTFFSHGDLLEHEDGGMMGLIRVEPSDGVKNAATKAASTKPNLKFTLPTLTCNSRG